MLCDLDTGVSCGLDMEKLILCQCSCKILFADHIKRDSSWLSKSKATKFQKKFSQKLRKIGENCAQEFQISTITCCAHLGLSPLYYLDSMTACQ